MEDSKAALVVSWRSHEVDWKLIRLATEFSSWGKESLLTSTGWRNGLTATS